MAQWRYQIHQKKIESGADLDEQLQKILCEYGNKGWELVQILRPQDSTAYRLVFKTQKPLYPTYG
jgi:hypothetical protein